MFKKYRIRSKSRFTIFVSVMLIVIIMCMGFITGRFDAEGSSRSEYVSVTVSSGDTLWDIACRYCDQDTDVRRFIHEISELNDVSAGELAPGQILLIPVKA